MMSRDSLVACNRRLRPVDVIQSHTGNDICNFVWMAWSIETAHIYQLILVGWKLIKPQKTTLMLLSVISAGRKKWKGEREVRSRFIIVYYMVSASVLSCTGRSSSTEEEELHSTKRHRLARKKSQILYPGERKGFRSMKVKCRSVRVSQPVFCIIARNKVWPWIYSYNVLVI